MHSKCNMLQGLQHKRRYQTRSSFACEAETVHSKRPLSKRLEAGWAPMRSEALAKAAKEESTGGEKLGLSVDSELSSGPG